MKKTIKKKPKVELQKLKIKCSCGEYFDFHLHMCRLGGVSEYCGCKNCGDYCGRCMGYGYQGQ